MARRVIAIVQARMGSSRLQGKALKAIAGRTLLSHVLERARAIHGLDEVVLATSVTEPDNAVADEGRRLGVKLFRGSEHDVLSRMAGAAQWAKADVVMRITGDCPLLAPEVAEQTLAVYDEADGWYVWNDVTTSGFPDGTDVEAFSSAALMSAARLANGQADREHVTPWIRRHYLAKTVQSLGADYSRYKLSVDRQCDLDLVRSIYQHLPIGQLDLASTMQAVQDAEDDAADSSWAV